MDELLQQARAALPERATPDPIPAVLERGGVVVDIRPEHLRARDGAIPGAVVIDRNVLEWRLDPSSDHRSPHIRDHDHEVVVVCDEGYASTLAAATLLRLGLRRATDLDGGFQAWTSYTAGVGEASTDVR